MNELLFHMHILFYVVCVSALCLVLFPLPELGDGVEHKYLWITDTSIEEWLLCVLTLNYTNIFPFVSSHNDVIDVSLPFTELVIEKTFMKDLSMDYPHVHLNAEVHLEYVRSH